MSHFCFLIVYFLIKTEGAAVVAFEAENLKTNSR